MNRPVKLNSWTLALIRHDCIVSSSKVQVPTGKSPWYCWGTTPGFHSGFPHRIIPHSSHTLAPLCAFAHYPSNSRMPCMWLRVIIPPISCLKRRRQTIDTTLISSLDISSTKTIFDLCWLYQGFKHAYHDASGLVATYAIAYDCIVVRAYAYCHLSRYIMSVVFCSLIPLVVTVSLNSQYNWVSPWFWLRPVHLYCLCSRIYIDL